MLRIGVDIGGTFTDVTVLDEETSTLSLGKVLTTPEDMVEGIIEGIEKSGASVSNAAVILHGSTVAINALLERRGSSSALITTKGFRDVYEIGRINRPDSFNLRFQKHTPLIPRHMRYEITERLNVSGQVLDPLDENEIRTLASELRTEVDSVAVALLHSYKNPTHELRVKQIFMEECPELFVTTSHELSREYREYERTSTTAANAYVGPIVSGYLERLNVRLIEMGFEGSLLIMQSNGGLMDSVTAREQCIQMLESGPAAGVTGTKHLADSLDIQKAIAFDMGGTTAKACVIENGTPRMASDYYVGTYATGLALRIPVMDIKEVGTGGGSIAWIDSAGGLHVGPVSASSVPGPACYGRGGSEPTVTDANVVLGRLGASSFLGGKMPLDIAAARVAISERVAASIGVDVEEAALGIARIAETSMAYAVRAVTTERGLDPREFVLFTYGGAGPLHAAAVARELGIKKVIIPAVPGLFSAMSMLQADLRKDVVRTCFWNVDNVDMADVEKMYEEMQSEVISAVTVAGVKHSEVQFIRTADMRYVGQEHTVTIEIPQLLGQNSRRALKLAFDEAHEIRYSHSAPNESVEMVSLRLAAIGPMQKSDLTPYADHGFNTRLEGVTGSRLVIFDDPHTPLECTIYDRSKLVYNHEIIGPAVIEEDNCTTLVPPRVTVRVGSLGQLEMEVNA